MFYGAGSWAEYCVVSETALVAVPDGVPDEVAAQFFVRLLTTPDKTCTSCLLPCSRAVCSHRGARASQQHQGETVRRCQTLHLLLSDG
jgi:hypothetical protein